MPKTNDKTAEVLAWRPSGDENLITSMLLKFDADWDAEVSVKTFTAQNEGTALDELEKFREHAQPSEFYRLVSISPFSLSN